MPVRVLALPLVDFNWVKVFSRKDSIYGKMPVILRALWFCFAALLMLLKWFVLEHVFRIGGEDGHAKGRSNSASSAEGIEGLPTEPEEALSESLLKVEEEDGEEKETFKFEFKFSFQNPESIARVLEQEQEELTRQKSLRRSLSMDLEETQTPLAIKAKNYMFSPDVDVRGFIYQPEVVTLFVNESFVGNSDSDESYAMGSTEMNGMGKDLKDRLLHLKSLEQSDSEGMKPEGSDILESVGSCEWEEAPIENFLIDEADDDDVKGVVVAGQEYLQSEWGSNWLDHLESPGGSDGYTVKDLVLGYASDDFLSEREPDDHRIQEQYQEALQDSSSHLETLDFKLKDENDMANVCSSEAGEQIMDEDESKLWSSEEWNVSAWNEHPIDLGNDGYSILVLRQPLYLQSDSEVESSEGDEAMIESSPDFNSPLQEKVDELEDEMDDIKLKCEEYQKHLRVMNLRMLDDSDEELEEEFEIMTRNVNLECKGKQENIGVNDQKTLEDWDKDGEEDVLESLWEHQDIVDQLKMEIKKAKDTKLPTILEDYEVKPEDLKAWKINSEFLQENPIHELQKFHKSYRERMRKFDLLNNQKMHAIEFLHLRAPFLSMGTGKSAFGSLFSGSFWHYQRKKFKNSPAEKFFRELQGDLETVYVGQMCLSWEFLWWQYEKFQELPESHSLNGQQYNQVAGQFQQFQVMIQRFLEDEPFQDARVPFYAKTRYSLHNLLQVPFIKEDSKKDKMEDEKKGSKIITKEDLNDIMERSIKVLWQFIKSDTEGTLLMVKGLARKRNPQQDLTDHELMAEIQENLQKKEKKLKDLLRVGNCIVKKFKKPQEPRLSKDLFRSQVDMILVSRVLNMLRITTDQLVWCHEKLENIAFTGRRLHRAPSFFFFPC